MSHALMQNNVQQDKWFPKEAGYCSFIFQKDMGVGGKFFPQKKRE